ncbi:MAG: hypothetical protein IT433_12830 [Phycisphaerales bacterium]|nr:hypothetical protein [Phycisphaerales bacterium]
MWTIPPLEQSPLVFPGIGVYDAAGHRVTVSTNVTEWNQAWLTFGLTDPRPSVTMPNVGTADPIPAPPFDGIFGPLPTGEYWLAVVRGGASFGVTNWDVRSTGDSGDDRDTILYIHIQPPDLPYCDGDFNWDGNVDQDDVMYLANVLAGGENPTGRWADYNRDGNEDQDDLLALVHTIAGGGCP